MIEASGRSVFVSELQFSVEEWAGERGPLIGLHGHLGAAHLFNGLGNLLAPAWRLLAFDQRGRGLADDGRGGGHAVPQSAVRIAAVVTGA